MKTDTSLLRCWCEIHLKNITWNLRAIRKLIGSHPVIMGLVKADAYGHGIVPIARHLAKSDCHQLGCAHVAEARLLRKAGIKTPILLLSAFLPSELPEILKLNVQVTVSSIDELKELEKACTRLKKRASVHVKIDTGMSRLGVFPKDSKDLFLAVRSSKQVKWCGTFTHYSCADSDQAFTNKQFHLFEKTRPQGHHHSCNSAAIFVLRKAGGDMVRPGLALYGISPLPKFQKLFKPVLEWKTRVTFIKEIKKGDPVSYNAIFHAPRNMTTATLAVGYGDGYFRALSNKAKVLIHGKLCPVVGRVTMDQIIVDISKVKNVKKGDEVVLIGKQNGNEILASQLASDASTIAYEVWTHITDRVPRIYVNQ